MKRPTKVAPASTNSSTVNSPGALPVGGGPEGGLITAVVIDPLTTDPLYAAPEGGGIYKSTDQAGSWTAMNSGLSNTYVQALAINPTTRSCDTARMRAKQAPGPQEDRFAAYMNGLAQAAGHTDREEPIKSYCKGLLLPGERKSVEPMAARLAPDNVRQTHQSLHHIVADSPWDDEVLLGRVRGSVLPEMEKKGEVEAWIIDDTGFPKKGTHSVGVTRQYCGQLGKQDNCRIAVSLSVATARNGDLVYFERMDGASARAVTSSQGKARAALLLGVPTKEAQDSIAAGKPLPVTLTSPPAGAWEITIGQGGLPIMKDGKVVAAMGCGGSTPANDEKFCQAGINAMTGK